MYKLQMDKWIKDKSIKLIPKVLTCISKECGVETVKFARSREEYYLFFAEQST
jgi:hypothetical protein